MEIETVLNFFDSSLFRFFRSKTLAEHAASMSRDEIYQWWVLCIFQEWTKIMASKNHKLDNNNAILPLVAFFEGYKASALKQIDQYLVSLLACKNSAEGIRKAVFH